MDPQYRFSKYSSIITRQCKAYYDRELKQFGIGSGQQFFLIIISENPGINLADLANRGGFDKSTITRSVKNFKSWSISELKTIRPTEDADTLL